MVCTPHYMHAALRLFFRLDLIDKIPEADAIGKNRFILFRIFTYSGSLVCLGVSLKMMLTLPEPGILPWIINLLAGIMLLNFYLVKSVEKLSWAYLVMLFAAFLLLHTVAYTCGGIRTGGILYYGVIILYAYMLLGKKGGQYFAWLFVANVIYFYFISTYTDWTSFALFKEQTNLINEDFLINAIFTFYLIASQGSFLQSGKNSIIQTLEKSKIQLEMKTIQLEENNYLLEEYTKKLEKSNRELDKFASVASHDLKAPLRAIATLSDLIEIEMEGMLNKESKKFLDTIKSRAGRMDQLLDALLKYSRAARKELLLQEINTDKLAEKILLKLSSGKNCNFKIKNVLPVVQADGEALQTIFEILIENAIRFNDKQVIEIEVSSEETFSEWLFKVKDNGPGINKLFQEKIFIIFQTINDRDSFESTGVGLAIAKRIIENKGGIISVNSAPGAGAEFLFRIPKIYNTQPVFNRAVQVIN